MSENNDQTINKIISLMKTDKSVDAPTDAIKWAKNVFLTRAAAPQKSFAQKVLAVLQMDLPPHKAAFDERSASAEQARQMLFQAGETSVDLRIKQEETGFLLHGQILGEDFANGTIKLGDFETVANEVSEFKFVKIPSGKYDLILQKDDKEIVVQDLELK
jgi:hypothetical protein